MENRVKTFQRWAKAKSILWIGLLLLGFANPQALLGQRISAGLGLSLFVCSDSTAKVWGFNWEVPIAVEVPNRIIAISAGGAHVLALRDDSTVWAGGKNDNGQLGLNDTLERTTLIQVPGLSDIVAISSGGFHSIALKSDSTVWVWGYNEDGQLGLNDTLSRLVPQQIAGLDGIVKITAGGYFSLALHRDGHVWAWGSNENGQVGDGNAAPKRLIPVLVTGVDSILEISAGGHHSLAIQSNGQAWAWGRNEEGQLGIGNNLDSPIPVQMNNGNGVTELVGGGYHTLAVLNNGSVWAVGENANGQLGLGDTLDRTILTLLGSSWTATSIAAGTFHSMIILPDGNCQAWGANFVGQVGNGTLIDQWSPTPVLGLCPTYFATPDTVFTNYFRPTTSTPGRWIAGELASSIRLMDGRMLWTFGKSYLDNLLPNNGIPCVRDEVANCLLVQDSLNPSTLTTYLDTVQGHPSRAYFQLPVPNSTHFVPGHGFQEHADTATIFLSQYADDTTFLGTWAAKIGIVTMTVLDITRIMPTNDTIDFGTAVIVDSVADQLYLYGSRKDSANMFFPYLSRRILSNSAAPWEFATPTGWSSQIGNARPISRFPVSARFSVTNLQGRHFLITQNPEPTSIHCQLQRNTLVYRSGDPKGPFIEGGFLATSKDSVNGFPVFAFNAYAHPDQHATGFTRCDSLLVSYNVRDDELIANGCSPQCSTQSSKDADTWRPKFIRVPYSLIDTSLSTTTVASFTSSQNGNTWTFTNTSQFGTEFFWDFGDGTSTAPNPTHTFTNSGPHTVTLTVSGCGSSHTITNPLVHHAPPTFVESRFTVFPQPSLGAIHIQGENLARGPVRFELYTLLGEMIAQEVHTSTSEHLEAVLQCQPPTGMYLLRISTLQVSAYFKIIVQ